MGKYYFDKVRSISDISNSYEFIIFDITNFSRSVRPIQQYSPMDMEPFTMLPTNMSAINYKGWGSYFDPNPQCGNPISSIYSSRDIYDIYEITDHL